MFVKWSDVLAQERHFEEIRQTVDAERQAGQLLDRSGVTNRVYWRWLARLGDWLVQVGCRLQTRAGAMPRLVYLTGADRTARPC